MLTDELLANQDLSRADLKPCGFLPQWLHNVISIGEKSPKPISTVN